MMKLIRSVKQPVPEKTDGGKPLNPEEEGYWAKKIQSDIGDIGHIGVGDVKTLLTMSMKMKNGEMIDDKEYLMEGLIQVSGVRTP